MKYLLSWVCKHIEINSWQDLGSIEDIVKKLTLHVSEIANYQKIDYKSHKFALATIINSSEDMCLASLNDEERVINLPFRKDLENGALYIILQQEDNKYRFATNKDFYADAKNNYIPAIYGSIQDNITILKQIKKQDDFSIKIDNTSINNRPDLFSHRGLARELAILFNKKFIEETKLISQEHNNNTNDNELKNKLFTIDSNAIIAVNAASGLFNEKESLLKYITLLAPLDITTHSYLIDLTNYIMLDIGQPMHVFDKKKIPSPLLITDKAEGSFDCLDNTTIIIKKNNIVISDKKDIHSLVGIIGGKKSSVNIKTKEIIIESAIIKKNYIINSAKYYNKKTESVIRNEKGAHPHASILAINRFIYLINIDFSFTITQKQFYINENNFESIKINLDLDYITKLIGITIDFKQAKNLLIKLGFVITSQHKNNTIIELLVPWWRTDIINQDDIAEEIARHIGYDAIPLNAPRMLCRGNIYDTFILTLKKNTILLHNSLEIISYGIANEEIKKRWEYQSNQSLVKLHNPYSDRQTHLNNSVLPYFLDIISKEIQKGSGDLSLFEINPLWHLTHEGTIKEISYYTACFYTKEAKYNFYPYAQLIKKIFHSVHCDLSFHVIHDAQKYHHNLFSNIAGNIVINDKIIGRMGFIDPLKLYKENKKAGSIFAVEINIDMLINTKKILEHNDDYLFFDISFLINKNIKIYSITDQLKIAFGNIMYINIIDWFESINWPDKRSVTIRIYIMNNDINNIYKEIKQYLINRNCTIR